MEHRVTMDCTQLAFDKNIEAVCKISSGDTVVFETEDANLGCVRKAEDIYSEFSLLYEKGGGANPVTGPVEVMNAMPGDDLAVEILDIIPGYWLHEGYSSLFAGLGMLQTNLYGLQHPLEPRTKICKVVDSYVYFQLHGRSELLKIPISPMIGTIGVAPKFERRASESLGKEFAGNMDITDVRKGSTVYLKVNVPGALLSLGDVHACQGDGEITGCALECQGLVTVRITRIPKEKARVINWPLIEDDMYIGVAIPLAQNDWTAAVKAGYTELSKILEKEYGIDILDAYQLMNLAGEVRVGSEYSAHCRIRKSILKAH